MTIDRSRASTLMLAAIMAAQLATVLLLARAAEAAPAVAHPPANTMLPTGFTAYGFSPVEGGECVAGDATREGMHGRAFVYVKDASTPRPRWVTAIPVPPHWYQNRATHCFAMDGSIFVLVQTDTNQATSLSQTLLNVVELSPITGKIIATRDADVPGIDAAYSSWVDKGAGGFHEDNGQIAIAGQYFLMDAPNKHIPFTAELTAHPAK